MCKILSLSFTFYDERFSILCRMRKLFHLLSFHPVVSGQYANYKIIDENKWATPNKKMFVWFCSSVQLSIKPRLVGKHRGHPHLPTYLSTYAENYTLLVTITSANRPHTNNVISDSSYTLFIQKYTGILVIKKIITLRVITYIS